MLGNIHGNSNVSSSANDNHDMSILVNNFNNRDAVTEGVTGEPGCGVS